MKVTVQIDTDELERLLRIVDAKEGQPRLIDGVLQSPGCEFDYGCCSKSFDLCGWVNELNDQVHEKRALGDSGSTSALQADRGGSIPPGSTRMS